MLGRAVPMIPLILVTLTTSVTFAALLGHFMMTKPATFSVQVNAYACEIYSDPTLITTASTIEFPSVIEGDIAGMTSTTSSYWVSLTDQTGFPYTGWSVTWSCTDLPSGLSLSGQRKNGVGEWVNWNPTNEPSFNPTEVVECRWIIDAEGVGIGDYSFTLDIITGEQGS